MRRAFPCSVFNGYAKKGESTAFKNSCICDFPLDMRLLGHRIRGVVGRALPPIRPLAHPHAEELVAAPNRTCGPPRPLWAPEKRRALANSPVARTLLLAAAPGSCRYPRRGPVDVRLSKNFELSKRFQFDAVADSFDTIQSRAIIGGVAAVGPVLLEPSILTVGRRRRASFQVRF